MNFPHWNPAILHAPGTCQACDQHPGLHTVREAWGIAYTGQPVGEPIPGQPVILPCPSDYRYGVGMRTTPPEPEPVTCAGAGLTTDTCTGMWHDTYVGDKIPELCPDCGATDARPVPGE